MKRQHYKNKKIYITIDENAKVQINDKWFEAVIYQEFGKPLNLIRTKEDFEKKFKEVK